MATTYSMQASEVVLLKDDCVAHAGRSSYSDELILTNLNLVVLKKKGMFGSAKEVRTFPVDQIKVYNGQAQALIGKSRHGSDLLEVYFLGGQETFAFQSGGKKKLNAWIAKINESVTGEQAPTHQAGAMAVPGAEMVAGVLRDTLGVFKTRLGSKPASPMKAAGKCGGCGAPVTGLQGQTTTCEYCGSAQQL